jgi:hypothetical protein
MPPPPKEIVKTDYFDLKRYVDPTFTDDVDWDALRKESKVVDSKFEWVCFQTEDEAFTFYYNLTEGFYQWKIPVFPNDDLDQMVLRKWAEWNEVKDPETGAIFYYNRETKESQWELPDGMDPPPPPPNVIRVYGHWEEIADEQSGNKHYFYNRQTGVLSSFDVFIDDV